jgi:hypothetical protein
MRSTIFAPLMARYSTINPAEIDMIAASVVDQSTAASMAVKSGGTALALRTNADMAARASRRFFILSSKLKPVSDWQPFIGVLTHVLRS